MKLFIKKLSLKLAEYQARLILSLIYFIVTPLFAVIFKLTRPKSKDGWVRWKIRSDSLDDLKKQF